MAKVTLFLLAFLCPTILYAAPVYLECKVSSDTEQKNFSVKLDEESGKITHTRADGSAFNAEGFFAANTITYQNIDILSSIKITIKYEIDRTTLNVQEVFVAEPADPEYARTIPAKTTKMNGSCRIVEVKKRKI